MVEKKSTLLDKLKFWVRPAPMVTPPRPDGHPPDGPTPVYGERVIIQRAPQGTSGTKIYSGFFSEEYFNTLQGMAAADQFDKMRRGDACIKMVLKSVKNPILGANWEMEPADDSAEAKAHMELVEHCLFKGMETTWRQHLSEALSLIDFGFSLFEVSHDTVFNHPKFGDFARIKSMGFRSQRTVYTWNLDHDTGNLASVTQWAVGDLQSNVDMPGEFLLPFSLDKEGDNYEGISAIRACYGAWSRKQLYLKLLAIGNERTAVPTFTAKVPREKINQAEMANMITALENACSHEKNYIIYPDGWEVGNLPNNFEPEKVKMSVEFENGEIVRSFLANFLLLGQTGHGTQSLSMDQSQFFLSSIQTIADIICEGHNKYTIPALVKMNFGEQVAYPKLKCSGISDKAGKELAEILRDLAVSQVIRPDDQLEDHVRKRLGLSKRSDKGVRTVKPPSGQEPGDGEVEVRNPSPAGGSTTLAEGGKLRILKLATRVQRERARTTKKFFDTAIAESKEWCKKGLTEISERMVRDIMAAYRKATPANRYQVLRGIDIRGKREYKSAFIEHLASIATKALEAARKEIPSKKAIKLAEAEGNLQLAEFERLPIALQKMLQMKSDLVVNSQMADIEKYLFAQYGNSVDSVGEAGNLLEQDLYDAGAAYLESASLNATVANTVSSMINEARNAFFFDDKVLEGVHSFTFTNPDPVTPICQDLEGQVFEADDPTAERFFPPLHHNCKSFLVPNLKGGDDPEITGLRPSDPALEKFMTLAEKMK